MHASDVMTRDVQTLSADASVFDAARLLLSSGIGAAPVLDGEGKLAGIVSEADLIRRADLGTEQRHSWFVQMLTDDIALAADYIRSHARKVADVMTRQVFTAAEQASLGEIATLMQRHRVRRVPIVRDGKVVGIVSRANLLQGLLAHEPKATESPRADEQIRTAVVREIETQHWSPSLPKNVIVENGVVHLWGVVRSATEKELAASPPKPSPV